MEGKTFLQHNSELHETMNKMKDSKQYPAETLRDMFILGMCYASKKSLTPLKLEEGKKQSSIRIPEVINDDHKFLFKVLAYAHARDYNMILNEEKFYELAEQFANSGMKEIIDVYYKTDYPSFKLAEVGLENTTKDRV